MATPTTKEEFADYCLRKLGHPIIKIEVSPEQIDDRIDEALKLFYERHYDAVEEVYILFDITGQEKANKYIDLDHDIIGVTDVFVPNYATGDIFSADFQLLVKEFYLNNSPYNFGDISYYYISRSYLSLLNRFFTPQRQFSFNSITHKLMIAGGLKDVDNMSGGVIIKAYKKVYGDTPDPSEDNTNNITANIWQNRWLQHYTTELIRMQWGQVLSKFQNVQMIGGVQMNGFQIMQIADENILKLENELKTTYELPPMFFIG